MSSPRPGMKDVISVKDPKTGKKQKLSTRLLMLNLSELYEAFKQEYPLVKVGSTKFMYLRPKNCIPAGTNKTHNVCVCATHQNVKLMLIGN